MHASAQHFNAAIFLILNKLGKFFKQDCISHFCLDWG